MRIITLIILSHLTALSSFAQILTPVKWSYNAKKVGEHTYQVHLTATMDEGWHIYSQKTPDGGPLATRITFKQNPSIALQDETKEVGKLEKKYEEVFGIEVKYYSDKVDFVRTVKLKNAAAASLSGTIEFMACDEIQCLPPEEVEFKVALN